MPASQAPYSSKIIKAGALLPDTKLLLAHWDKSADVPANLECMPPGNIFGRAFDRDQRMRITCMIAPISYGRDHTCERGNTYRLEVGCSPGTGRLRVAGGIDGLMKESIQRSFAHLQGHKVHLGISQALDTTDFHVEAIDLLVNRTPCEAGVALVVAIYSALKSHSALPALVILGDLTIQGNLKPLRSLAEPLQVAMDNGARRALIPIENKRTFLDVSSDIVEQVDPVFYSDPLTAAMKALGMK